jgi:hypothetical protein
MRYALCVMLVAGLVLAVVGGTAFTQATGPAPDRIEEDWQLVVANPDPDLDGPQSSTSMQPGGDDSSPVVVFSLNYQDYPAYQPGGLQIKAWNNDQVLTTASQGQGVCETSNETITWTQRMTLSGGSLSYKIVSGQSTTWGQFGQGDNDLSVSAASSVASLSGYSPDTSVAKSGVSFQSNRVTSMTLSQVRYYQGNTLLSTDTNPRSVNLSN